eukprot:g5673.t1
MFKKGAFIPAEPVQPIGVRFPNQHFDVSWSIGKNDPGMLHLVFRTMIQLYNNCELIYFPVYYPNEQEKADPGLYANNVRALMAKELNVNCTNHCYDDVYFAKKCGEEYLKKNILNKMSASDVYKLTNLKRNDALMLLKNFKEKDKNNDGTITFETFCETIGNPPSELNVSRGNWNKHLERIFNMLDSTGDGLVDYREMIFGLALGGNNTNENMLNLAFEIYDADGNGTLSRLEVERVLTTAKRYRPRVASDENATEVTTELDLMFKDAGTDTIDQTTFHRLAKKNPIVLENVKAMMKSYLKIEIAE